MNKFNIGDLVRVATGCDANSLQQGYRTRVDTETVFRVAVIIEKGKDWLTARGHSNNCSGLIITRYDGKENGYPYVWNESRFVKHEEANPTYHHLLTNETD